MLITDTDIHTDQKKTKYIIIKIKIYQSSEYASSSDYKNRSVVTLQHNHAIYFQVLDSVIFHSAKPFFILGFF